LFVLACCYLDNFGHEASPFPFVAASSLFLASSAFALSGTVVSVADGDTLTVLDASLTQHRVRLVEIDAPEKQQAFGQRSKQSLAQLCFNKQATVQTSGTDKYQRVLGTVYCGGVNANRYQVQNGFAWVYRQYASPSSPLFAIEEAAKAQKLGLWQDPNPIPPWDWRHSGKNSGVASFSPNRAVNESSAPYLSSSGVVRGNRRSQIYHLADCPNYNDVSPHNRVEFRSEQAAKNSGFRKARNCP